MSQKVSHPISSMLKMMVTCGIIVLMTPALIMAQSPYQSSYTTDGWISGVGSVIAFSAFLSAQSIIPLSTQEINQLSSKNVNAFDRAAIYNYSKTLSQISDVLVGVNAASAMLLLLNRDIRHDWHTLGIMSLETACLITAVPMLVKGRVQRIRPYVYNPDVPLYLKTRKEGVRSFFSGHATVAFASAVFISTVYSDYFPHSKWRTPLWTGSLLLASTVGLLRFESGKHFPTDILTGALVGSAIGYIIPVLHRTSKSNLAITPAAGDQILKMDIRFRF